MIRRERSSERSAGSPEGDRDLVGRRASPWRRALLPLAALAALLAYLLTSELAADGLPEKAQARPRSEEAAPAKPPSPAG